MKVERGSLNQLWSEILIEEFVRQKITRFIISPGSRSTPLTLAVAENKKTDACVWFDERGGAFRAVGFARATGKAAVLICTSGTAVANYLPAVCEASNDNLPLIILSADRPPELHDRGANQTMNQKNIFGTFVRESIEIPVPSDKISPTFILEAIAKAVSTAHGDNSGPVHLNCPFREPLSPPDEKLDFTNWASLIKRWLESDKPYTALINKKIIPNQSTIETVSSVINSNTNGIIVVGRLNSAEETRAVSELASKLQWPLLPDIQSGLRLGLDNNHTLIYYDLLLNSSDVLDGVHTVLHIGGQLTSKRLQQSLRKLAPGRYIQFTTGPWRIDPDQIVTEHFQSDITEVCSLLCDHISRTTKGLNFSDKNKKISKLIVEKLDSNDELSELSAARIISQTITKDNALFLASSLPIRLFESYADSSGAPVVVGVNRGVSGIDGTLASAIGFAEGLIRPVTLFIGDLALLHDLNSLAMLKEAGQPITIVVLNNGGGGIFSLLPVAEQKDNFERYFAAAHELTFESAAEMFSIEYKKTKTNSELKQVYNDARQTGRSSLIELKTDRAETAALIKEINRQVANLFD